MAKARTATTARRTSRKPPRQRQTARRRPAAKRTRPVRARKVPSRSPASPALVAEERQAAPPPDTAPARKPTYHEAVALYERGLQALQRRDFAAAADALRSVIQQYPDERELLERARLYLKVCERELEPREPAPKTADEWVYAATVAFNSGNEALALQHLQRALGENPRHDHAHYMMAVASLRRAKAGDALEHLRQAVRLNPENRSLARQDPDLEALRDEPGFRQVIDAPAAAESPARAAVSPSPARSRKTRR
jgi:tetratricopeptide (TPR) repeat protein